jgi:hypothetical protein
MFESVTNKYHLRDLLLEESKKDCVDIQMHTYSFDRNKRGYLYTKCINCNKNKMKFLKINGDLPNAKYKLVFFDNTHSHTQVVKKKKHLYNMG